MANYKTGSIGSIVHSNSAASQTCTPGTSAAVGERIIVCCGAWTNGTPGDLTVSDDLNGSYALDSAQASFNDGGFISKIGVFSVNVTSAGTPTITVSSSGAASVGCVALIAQSTPTSTPVDVHKEATGSGGTASSAATSNTTGSSEYAVGFFYDDGYNITMDATSVGSGWTYRADNGPDNTIDMFVEDQGSISSGVGITANLASGIPGGSTSPWAMLVVVYKDAVAAAPAIPNKIYEYSDAVRRAALA